MDDPLPKGATVRYGVTRPILRLNPHVGLIPPKYTNFLAPTMTGGIRRYDLSTGRPLDVRGIVTPGQVIVSADGMLVDFGYEAGGKAPARFDLRQRQLLSTRPADALTAPPRQTGLALDGWEDTYQPTLNGNDLGEIAKKGVWLAKAGFGAFKTAFEYAPLVAAARAHGMITTCHTGGPQLP